MIIPTSFRHLRPVDKVFIKSVHLCKMHMRNEETIALYTRALLYAECKGVWGTGIQFLKDTLANLQQEQREIRKLITLKGGTNNVLIDTKPTQELVQVCREAN